MIRCSGDRYDRCLRIEILDRVDRCVSVRNLGRSAAEYAHDALVAHRDGSTHVEWTRERDDGRRTERRGCADLAWTQILSRTRPHSELRARRVSDGDGVAEVELGIGLREVGDGIHCRRDVDEGRRPAAAIADPAVLDVDHGESAFGQASREGGERARPDLGLPCPAVDEHDQRDLALPRRKVEVHPVLSRIGLPGRYRVEVAMQRDLRPGRLIVYVLGCCASGNSGRHLGGRGYGT